MNVLPQGSCPKHPAMKPGECVVGTLTFRMPTCFICEREELETLRRVLETVAWCRNDMNGTGPRCPYCGLQQGAYVCGAAHACPIGRGLGHRQTKDAP